MSTTPKKATTRRYHLVSKNEAPAEERIIIATSPSQALSHAARTDWGIEVLDMDNAIRLTKEGVVDEIAGEAPIEQGTLSLGGGET